ncbi:hypothetical protein BH10BAC4_BH10BAC4_24690 [soil metagenome]
MLDIGLYAFYVLLIIGIAVAAFWPLVHAAQDPKSIGKSALGIGTLVLIFVIAYLMSGGEVTPQYETLGVHTEFSSKMIGAGMMMFYIVLIGSIIAIVFAEISKSLK